MLTAKYGAVGMLELSENVAPQPSLLGPGLRLAIWKIPNFEVWEIVKDGEYKNMGTSG